MYFFIKKHNLIPPPWAQGPHTKKHKKPLEMEPARARAHGPPGPGHGHGPWGLLGGVKSVSERVSDGYAEDGHDTRYRLIPSRYTITIHDTGIIGIISPFFSLFLSVVFLFKMGRGEGGRGLGGLGVTFYSSKKSNIFHLKCVFYQKMCFL
jgi:hypothetical protein